MKRIVALIVIVSVGAVFAQGITHMRAPKVSLTAQAKRTVVEKAIMLKRGDHFQSVTNTLAVPTTDTNYGGDWHILEYHMQVWEGAYGEDSEFIRIRLDQSNRVTSVWIRAELQ